MVVAAAMLAVFAPVQASTATAGEQWFSFTISCSNTSATNVTDGASQLFVRVQDVGGGKVEFQFINAGPKAMAISEVYFDDGHLLGISAITNGPGVVFLPGANPGNLPAGNSCSPQFHVTAGFLAEADNPPPKKGVGPGEWLKITFDIKPGKTFDDIVADLGNRSLRIGLHVIGFANGGSESFINSPITAVQLSSFTASPGRGQVTLTWSTGAEMQNAGFNLYRATSASGQRVKVNPMLLAAKGSEVSGATYSQVDVPGNGAFYYWLEDVDYTGHSTLHGPVVVTLRAALQRPAYRPTLPTVTR
jgi:hypothetical protein